MAVPGGIVKNKSLEDERKMLEKMNKELPKKFAEQIRQINSDPKKQVEMLKEFRELLKTYSQTVSSAFTDPKLTTVGKEEYIHSQMTEFGYKLYRLGMHYCESPSYTSDARDFILRGLGGAGVMAAGMSIVAAPLYPVLTAIGLGYVAVMGASYISEIPREVQDADTYSSMFTTNVAKELGIKISEFTPGVKPKKLK